MLFKNRLNYFLLILLLSGYVNKSVSQNSNNKNWSEKLVFGGNMGFQFGSETRIDISPEVGYKTTDKLIVGAGITYQYYNWKLYNYSTSLYGGKLFSKYSVFKNIFAQVEYEVLSLETSVFDIQNIHLGTNRYWINSVFIGGGFRQSIGNNLAFVATVLWNINESPDSPYSNPIIRFGFVF
ncbi:MAG: hypothetical protein GXO79_14080 [Chlorobi bacterium]|nr:hypothetical protein [Chlorobiota bacterium]